MVSVLEYFGKFDIVVNNVGIMYCNCFMLEVEEDEFDCVYVVNVKSIFFLVKIFVFYFC